MAKFEVTRTIDGGTAVKRKATPLDTLKEWFFNEASELALASESDIQRLATWLEANDYDSDLAWQLWDSANEELSFLRAEFSACL